MRRLVIATTLLALVVLAGCIGSSSSDSVGFAAGGAQDANDFRHNVNAGYVPQPASLPAEGLYHDYYFDTGQTQPCNATFCPSYSRAVTKDPISGNREQFLTVGLNSGIDANEFERKPLNLVVVVDTSGSMESPFGSYYYDNGTRKTVEDDSSKMAAARSALRTLTTHLTADDRFGVVAYDDDARRVVDMARVGDRDMDAVNRKIGSLRAGGSTNLDAGMTVAEEMLRPYRDADRTERETRVVYLTDAMPNVGTTDGGTLGDRLAANADAGVYSTFVGVGVDFNARFVDTVNDVEGANHYVVKSPSEFADRMDEGFAYMVSPLVFDLSVSVNASDYRVERVYGSPDANATTGDVISVNTLFPSRTSDGKTEGGVVLVELERVGNATPTDDGPGSPAAVTLTARYETRNGERHATTRTVAFADREAPYYESTGVRKAVLLAEYATLMQNWMAYERATAGNGTVDVAADDPIEGRTLGEWEQRSVALRASPPYRDRIRAFREHFANEANALDDDALNRELAIMDAILAAAENATDTQATFDARPLRTAVNPDTRTTANPDTRTASNPDTTSISTVPSFGLDVESVQARAREAPRRTPAG
ncbi:vWA domain-containing protein [Halorubellus litoreus]|uniref:VWA domain-containing protein n=1 Tax=Halorubellus litoreus TaxID=755308 RepID=A0ABD5VFI6_9EURY